MKTFSLLLLIALATLVEATALQAEPFRLGHIFQDHMVLQRDKPVALWGWADPGTGITVSFAGQTAQAEADASGRWQVALEPLSANSTGQPLTVTAGDQSLTLNDVLVGEVWMSAGQSNMARTFQLDKRAYPETRVAQAEKADFPLIRFINYEFNVAREPLDELDRQRHEPSRWQVVTPNTIGDSSSLHYFFSKRLHEELGVPVGMVQIARSGSNQVAWMRREDIESSEPGRYQKSVERCDKTLAGKGENGIKSWADFEKAREQWRAGFQTGDRSYQNQWPGASGPMQRMTHSYPSTLYNALVHPLAPLTLRGVIWHQGEGGPAENYGARFPAMVRHWRDLYQQDDLVFIWGTLAANLKGEKLVEPVLDEPRTVNLEFLVAEDALQKENAYLCSFLDLGNGDLHWEAKDKAGERMAHAALIAAYGREGDPTGPILDSATFEGGTARLAFRHAESGLELRPSGGLSGILLEGRDGTFAWADVTVEGNVLLCSSDKIPQPVNAHYAGGENPHFTLFNKQGLPAPAFRAVGE